MSEFNKDLQHSLEDPESAAYFAGAQIESAQELLKCGIITSLNVASNSNKIARSKCEGEA